MFIIMIFFFCVIVNNEFFGKKIYCKEYNFIYYVFWELFLKFIIVMFLFCVIVVKYLENFLLIENIMLVIVWYVNNKNLKLYMYYSFNMVYILFMWGFLCVFCNELCNFLFIKVFMWLNYLKRMIFLSKLFIGSYVFYDLFVFWWVWFIFYG